MGGNVKEKLIANQYPTKSFFIDAKKSDYKKAIGLYRKTKRKEQKWQEILLKELFKQNNDGLWTHTKFAYSLPRRNGKNEIVAIRELYGLIQGEKGLHTAHRVTTSHSAFERLITLLNNAGYAEKLDYKALRQMGLEKIEFFQSGGTLSFRTRSAKGGLGEGFDYMIIDEAQEYTQDQESALKYVVTDSDNPQTIFCGTPPTLISGGTVFPNLRKQALDGKAKNTAWAEWSVENEVDVHDKGYWYLTNPSLGTIFTERSIEDEITDDIIDFNIQRLGLWLKYNQKSAVSEKDWQDLKIKAKPIFRGELFAGVKYGKDGKNVSLAIAVKTLSGRTYLEVIDCQNVRNGNLWIIDFLKNADVESVIIDGASGQNLLMQEIKDYNIDIKVILPTVKEIITANAKFEQGVFNKTILHNDQPSLTQVVQNSEKRQIGSQGGFGYKAMFEENEIALMDSIILANYLASEKKKKVVQKIYV